MKYVYVLDQERKPLMPTCRYGKVRRMLHSSQAKVVSTIPFTIQLTYKPKTHVLQQVVVGCDPGRTNIGLAAVREDGTCLYRAHCTSRNKEIVKLMSDRLAYRRASRRGERLARKRLAKKLGTTAKKLLNRILPGCNEPLAVKDIINTESRFNNRVRPQGWLIPSATQLLRTHLNFVNYSPPSRCTRLKEGASIRRSLFFSLTRSQIYRTISDRPNLTNNSVQRANPGVPTGFVQSDSI